MKRFVILCLTLTLVLCGLGGCSKYSSHYSAVMYAHSNDSDSAEMSFYIFDGTEVFTLKSDSSQTAKIRYTGKLETGSLTVFIDCGEGKTELFSLHAGEEINADSDPVSAKTITIIVETSEKCESGALTFELVSD